MKHCSLWLMLLVLCAALFTGGTSSGTTLPQNIGFYAGDANLKLYDSSGNPMQTFAGVTGVYDVVISPKTGNLFASSPGSNKLFQIDVATGLKLDDVAPATSFSSPSNMAFGVGEDRFLYVVNRSTDMVFQVWVEHEVLDPLVMRMDIGSGLLTNPSGIAFDSFGNMFISSGANDIVKLNSGFAHSNTLNPAGLVDPGGLGFSDAGLLYVVSQGTNSVLEIDPATEEILRTFGGGEESPLSDPKNVSVSPGVILVSDADGVVMFNLADGTHHTYGTGGASAVAAVVPEPATMAIVAIGLGALAYRRRRKS